MTTVSVSSALLLAAADVLESGVHTEYARGLMRDLRAAAGEATGSTAATPDLTELLGATA